MGTQWALGAYCRKASIGFTFEARRAGTPPARVVTTTIVATATTIVSGSLGDTPYTTVWTN